MRNGILTFSGRFVPSDEAGDIPSITDIGRSLARMPRFAGYCRRPWSVADHSLFCAELTSFRPEAALAYLLHDAHEAVTGDIPRPFKSKEMARIQRELDKEIAEEYHPGGRYSFDFEDYIVADADRRALLAEALIVGPPALKDPSDVESYFGEKPRPEDVTLLTDMLRECRLGLAPEAMQERFVIRYYQLYLECQ
jgi:hypothetical protein